MTLSEYEAAIAEYNEFLNHPGAFLMRSLVKRMLKSEMEPDEEIPDKIDLRDNERVREWITGLVQR